MKAHTPLQESGVDRDVGSIQKVGEHMQLGAPSRAIKGSMYAEKGHFIYKIFENVGARTPYAPRFLLPWV